MLCAVLRVTARRGTKPGPDGWLLLRLRRIPATDELKCYLSNGSADMAPDRLKWLARASQLSTSKPQLRFRANVMGNDAGSRSTCPDLSSVVVPGVGSVGPGRHDHLDAQVRSCLSPSIHGISAILRQPVVTVPAAYPPPC